MIYFVRMMLCACYIYSVVCMIAYVVMGTEGANYMFYMQCYVHVVNAVLCIFVAVYNLYILCCCNIPN